jgi:hypothetical protein
VTIGTGTTTRNAQLTSLPRYSVSGVVRDVLGNALAGVPVGVGSTPIPAVKTDTTGRYALTGVPQGTYLLGAQPGRCNESAGKVVTVTGNVTADFALSQKMDPFGYTCQTLAPTFISGSTKLAVSGDDAATAVTLPFSFRLYGQHYTTAYISTNGFLNFEGLQTASTNYAIPDYWNPNAAIYAFWDDLVVDGSAGVYTTVQGSAPNRQFVVEWRNVAFFDDTSKRVRVEVVLYEDGRILLQYADIGANDLEEGSSATIGVENQDSYVAFQYANDEPVLRSSLAIRFTPPVTNLLKNPGFELDANFDNHPDNWSTNSNFSYWDDPVRNGIYAGQHQTTADANYTVGQLVTGIVAGQKYSFAGWVNIPGNGDSFAFRLEVQWRDAANAPISTQTIKTYTDSTGGWNEAASNSLVAPTGATRAYVQMRVSSLNGTVYVDDLIFGK